MTSKVPFIPSKSRSRRHDDYHPDADPRKSTWTTKKNFKVPRPSTSLARLSSLTVASAMFKMLGSSKLKRVNRRGVKVVYENHGQPLEA